MPNTETEQRYTVYALREMIRRVQERESQERGELLDHVNGEDGEAAVVADHLNMPVVKWRSEDDIPVRVVWASNAVVVLVNDGQWDATTEFFESVENVMAMVNDGLAWCRATHTQDEG